MNAPSWPRALFATSVLVALAAQPSRLQAASAHHSQPDGLGKPLQVQPAPGQMGGSPFDGHEPMINGAVAADGRRKWRPVIDSVANINHNEWRPNDIGPTNKGAPLSLAVVGYIDTPALADDDVTAPGQRARRQKRLGPDDDGDRSGQTSAEMMNSARPNTTMAANDTNDNNGQQANSTGKLKCRVEKDLYLDFEEYRHYTCAFCYNQVPRVSFKRKLLYKKEARIWLYDDQLKRALLPNETHLIRETFKDESIYDKWRACCRHAVDCCLDNWKHLPTTTNSLGQLVDRYPRTQCPATWDGLTCWQNSPAGQLAWRECPRHVYFLSFEPACTGHVSKQCFANASWFIRNDHEWSDYSHCAVLPIYVKRMLFSAAWHIISALVITPALLTINKFSNRGGNKRVKILRNLLFWLLVNSCIQATQKSAIVSGLFEADRSRAEEAPPPPRSGQQQHQSQSGQSQVGSQANVQQDNGLAMSAPVNKSAIESRHARAAIQQWREHGQLPFGHRPLVETMLFKADNGDSFDEHFVAYQTPNDIIDPLARSGMAENLNQAILKTMTSEKSRIDTSPSPSSSSSSAAAAAAASRQNDRQLSTPSHRDQNNKLDTRQTYDESIRMPSDLSATMAPDDEQDRVRCKRDDATSKPSDGSRGPRRQRSALVIFFCWFLVVASRIVRLMGYSWMFTGAIYLCSALHFAPAEPPAQFIKILMFLTNAFPILIALVYVTSRTIVEPSPLNIIFKVPYYKLIGDKENVDYLWATQLECWFDQSKYESIEEIADLPNLILVCLNVGLFIITLIILCRINRPGSTRPDMSPLTYFKAAGTLVVLYGGHYALLAYRPNAEGCYYDTFMFYAFLFVDGIQGITVSYVFCYRTQEGREIIGKYWRNKHQHAPFKWCNWLYCKNKQKAGDNGHLATNSRSNQSTSGCNGYDTVTELINVNDTPSANHF